MAEFIESKIVKIIHENQFIYSFLINPFPEEFITMKPGQYLLLKVKRGNDWSEPHPFTITSQIEDNFIRITVKKIGAFTTNLHSLTIPETVLIKGPMGDFGIDILLNKKIICIAGGIGITPFISLITYLHTKKSNTPITLFWANESIDDLFYIDEINKISKNLNIEIILIINKPFENDYMNDYSFVWKKGYLTKEILESYTITKNASYYMCGSPNMQKYIYSQLEPLKITPEMIISEKIGIYMN